MKPRTLPVPSHSPSREGRAGTPLSLRVAHRLYRVALTAFPTAFRQRFGAEMEHAFGQDVRRARRRHPAAVAPVLARATWDALRQGTTERLEAAGILRPNSSGGARPPLPPAPRGFLTMLQTVLQDVRFAVRTLSRSGLFAGVVVLSLALGIGATTAVFTAVDAIVLSPLPYPRPDELVVVWEPSVEDLEGSGAVSPVDLGDWQQMSRSFAALGGLRSWRATVTGLDAPESLRGYRVSIEALQALEVEPLHGRLFTAAESGNSDARVVLLLHSTWQRLYGGDTGVVGNSIRLNDEDWQIVGILPPAFRVPFSEETAVVAPYDIDAAEYSRGARFLRVLGRLAPGVTLAEAQADMDRIAARLREDHPNTNAGVAARVVSLHTETLDGVDRRLWLLMGSVAFVLLVTVVNVANLMIARAASRQGEIAIRSALGAGRGRIGRQFLTEALLLSGIGGALGLVLATVGLGALVTAAPDDIPRLGEIAIDPGVVMFCAALSLLVGLAFGCTPWVAGRRETADVLRRSPDQLGRSGHRFRRALVALQIAVALVLLIGSGLLLNSLTRLLSENPGFDPDGVYASRVRLGARYDTPELQSRFYSDLLATLEGRPDVVESAAAFLPPFSGGGVWGSFDIEGAPEPAPGEGPTASIHSISAGFVELLDVPLLAGRSFTADDAADDEPVAMVSQTAARLFWPDGNPVGSTITLRVSLDDQDSDRPRRVVGVLGDLHHRRLDEEVNPFVFVPAAQYPTRSMYVMVRVREGTPSVATLLRGAVDDLDPEIALERVQDMESMIGSTVASDRFAATLLSAFAVAALILGCVGIYGVVAYGVAQRSGEFGVRLAIGATRSDIGRLVLRDTVLVALVGIGVGIVASLLMSGVLEGMLHELEATDPTTFVGMSLLLLAAALVASAIPARRAARIDPIRSLRQD